MPRPRLAALPRRERQIVDTLFELGGPASVRDIRQHLPDPPSYSAVRAMLGKLEKKGFVEHSEAGLRYLYSPTIPRATARRVELEKLVRLFDGSATMAAAALVKHEGLTDDELDDLSAEIARIRMERKRR